MFLTHSKFPSAILPAPSGPVVRVAVTVHITGTTFLVLAQLLAWGLLDFRAHKLHKICALLSLFIRLGPACIPTIFNRSTVLVEATAVVCVVALERPPMLLA